MIIPCQQTKTRADKRTNVLPVARHKMPQSNNVMKSYLLARCPVFSRRTLRNNGSSPPFRYPTQQPPPPDSQNSSRCQHALLRRPACPTSSQVRGRLALPPLPSSLGYSCRWSFKEKGSRCAEENVVLECQQRAGKLIPGGFVKPSVSNRGKGGRNNSTKIAC